MTKQDVLNASGSDHAFTDWLGFELDHEDVTDPHTGTIKFENVPGDGGGLTFAGIDQSSHQKFPFSHPTPEAVVNEYTDDWLKSSADRLPAPVGATVANYSVNCGESEAARLLQMAVHAAPDGVIGPQTLSLVKQWASPQQLALKIVDLADIHYEHLADNNSRLRQFLHGWLNRDADLRTFDKNSLSNA
jgi:lysozyme family protein